MEIFAFRVITLEAIMICTHQATQNHHMNLKFVKDDHIVGKKKWPEMMVKWPFILFV